MSVIDVDRNTGYVEEREIYTRGARMVPDSVNEEKRSVEAVIASENPVRMYDYHDWEVVDEVLTMDGLREVPKHVTLLDNHWRTSNKDVIGSCREIRVEGTQLVGRNFFASDVESDKIFRKVVDGHIRDNSIGYHVKAFEKLQPGQTSTINGRKWTAGEIRPLKVVTDWELRENSITPIGADSTAKMRSKMSEKAKGSKVVEPKERKELDSERKAREAQAKRDEVMAFCPESLRSVAEAGLMNDLSVEEIRQELIKAHAEKAKPVGTPEPTIERADDEDSAPELTEDSLKRCLLG